MDRAVASRRRCARMAVVALPVAFAIGCSSTSVRTDLNLGRPHDEAGERRRPDEHAGPRRRSRRSRDPRPPGPGRVSHRSRRPADVRIPKLLNAAGSRYDTCAKHRGRRPDGRRGARLPAGRPCSCQRKVTLPLIGSIHAAGRTPIRVGDGDCVAASWLRRHPAPSRRQRAGRRVSQQRRRGGGQRRATGALSADAAGRDHRRPHLGGRRPEQGRGSTR